MTFGLNALYGRHEIKRGAWGGEWDSSNAKDFIKYTISKGHHIDSWEFGTLLSSNHFVSQLTVIFCILILTFTAAGNELSGSGIGASVGVEQYGKDLIKLKNMINELYKNFNQKPLLVAPGGFYDKQWYNRLLQVSGSLVVNAMTHHIYNLGAGG